MEHISIYREKDIYSLKLNILLVRVVGFWIKDSGNTSKNEISPLDYER